METPKKSAPIEAIGCILDAGQDAKTEILVPHGCVYAIVSQGGYQDPKDANGIDQFIATHLYLARMGARRACCSPFTAGTLSRYISRASP
jgi:hypothetical protein